MPILLENLNDLEDLDRFGKVPDLLGPCQLRLQVPATVEHLRSVRLVAADAANRAGFDCDETHDLRIAVDEVCHAVIRTTEAPITVGFCTRPGSVEVRGAARHDGIRRPLHLEPLSHLVVDAVSDEVQLVEGWGGVWFSLVKRADRGGTRS